MDPIMIEKLQAMKMYRRKRHLILSSFMQLSLTIILLGLFLSCPLWLPYVGSYLRFFFVFLPKTGSLLLKPKCLFFVCNIIIIVLLVSESKKLSSPSACTDIYEEFVRRSKSLQGLSASGPKEKGSELDQKAFVHENKESDEGIHEEEEEGIVEEQERGLDELNKRVEDFIARVNKQRRLEARMEACVG